jgi:hypothetical protein
MVYIPAIDASTKRVLRVIRTRGVVPGFQVISEAAVNPDELSRSANELVKMGLISAKGNISNASEIADAYFVVLPSNADFADLVLNAP